MFIDLRNYKGSEIPQGLSARSFAPFAIGDVETTEDDPIIGSSNVATRGTVTASSEAVFNPAVNMTNPSTYLKWVAGAAGAATITINTAGKEVNYIGLARHNFGSLGLTLTLTGNQGGNTVALSGAIPIASDNAIFFRFDKAAFDSVTIALSAGGKAASLAVIYVGELLTVPHGIPTGYTPLKYGINTEVVSGKSQSGEFLGRVILSEGSATSIPLQYLDGDWYRQKLAPLIREFRTLPFFFAWSPRHYPEEAGFCWVTNNPKPSIDTEGGLINITLEVGGLSK